MPGGSVRCGRAFAPAHVSGIFVPRLDSRDPRGRGSLGAGLVLDAGVWAYAEWQATARSALRVTADVRSPLEISEAVARRLLARRRGRLTLRLEHALPIGQGFGSSAAGALATGLAVAAALQLPRGRAVEVAHLADLFGGGGLGGVAAILGGGLEVRLRAGIPPFGRIVREPVDRTVLVGTVGAPIRSPGLLHHPARMRRFADATGLFEEFAARPSWEAFWTVSERFTDSVRLTTPRLTTILRGLRRRGARAAQAMFGRSFFAAPPPGEGEVRVRRWLTEGEVPFREIAVARRGARRTAVSGDGPTRPGPGGDEVATGPASRDERGSLGVAADARVF